jgi:hypothetical protein
VLENNSVSYVRIALNPLLGDPREQLRRATCDLTPGRNVRVLVKMRPVPLGFPVPNHLDFGWCRPDLLWEFESDRNNLASADWASDWEDLANYLGGAR